MGGSIIGLVFIYFEWYFQDLESRFSRDWALLLTLTKRKAKWCVEDIPEQFTTLEIQHHCLRADLLAYLTYLTPDL